MDSTSLVIALLTVGSVLMDSNLKELCSKSYFDSFGANYPVGALQIQLTRRMESNEDTYHYWILSLEEQPIGYKLNGIHYYSKVGQTPESTSWQPKECPKRFQTISPYRKVDKTWFLTSFRISNYIEGMTITDLTGNMTGAQLTTEPVINSSNIWFTGILCRPSDTSFYVVVEDRNSKHSSKRTQIVRHLFIEKTDAHNKSTVITVTKLYFRLEPMNQTLFEFFGIDCPEEPWILTETLFQLFLGLGTSAIILSVVNLILVIRRKRNQIPDLSDDTSGQTVKKSKTSSSGAQTMDTLTLVSDTI